MALNALVSPLRRLITHIGLPLCVLASPSLLLGEQQGPVYAPVPANVLFLVDASSSMADCYSGDFQDTTGDGSPDTCRGGSKLGAVQEALKGAAQALSYARVGLAQTDPSDLHAGIGTKPSGFTSQASMTRSGIISPLGAPRWDFNAALSGITLNAQNAGSFAEGMRDIIFHLWRGVYHCDDLSLCADSPHDYEDCQENYVIILTDGISDLDINGDGVPDLTVDNVPTSSKVPIGPNDVKNGPNEDMDNLAAYLVQSSRAFPFPMHTTAKTYVISMDVESPTNPILLDPIELYDSVALEAGTSHYTTNNTDELKGALSRIIQEIVGGAYAPLPPSISPIYSNPGAASNPLQPDKMESILIGWYDAHKLRPLHRGTVQSIGINADMDHPNYGYPLVSSPYSWNAGINLSLRSVTSGESRESSNGNNGESIRDIFTNINGDGIPDAFDSGNVAALCPKMLDNTPASGSSPSQGYFKGHDINGDLQVDVTDCQLLIDFIRGNETSDFLSTGQTRGTWKLGSIRHSQIAVAVPEPKFYSRNSALTEFQEIILAKNLTNCPASPTPCDATVAFATANDGMLHAFNAYSGDELWAYIPQPLLGETVDDYLESASLLDLMWGERILMDATPQISYVWIDGYQGYGNLGGGDGEQQADEWVRLLTVGMGEGGRYTLGMDITQPDSPYILWEDSASDAFIGFGATTSTPQTGLLQDGTHNRWTSFYGSGLEHDGYLESRLYMRSVSDLMGHSQTFSDQGISLFVDLNIDNAHDGTGLNSTPLLVDHDIDGFVDEVFIANSGGVLTKFMIDSSDPDASTGCIFFDPEEDLPFGSTQERAPAQYAATAAYLGSGELLVFWGTGSPYDPLSETKGGMYVLKNTVGSCDRAIPHTGCNSGSTEGYIPFEVGERLTGDPIVFGGVLFFVTFAPSTNRCDDGEARLWGVLIDSCGSYFDSDDDPSTPPVEPYVVFGAGLASGPVISNDMVYVAYTDPSNPSADPQIHAEPIGSALSSSVSIQFRERY